jgi:hypothetical protein
MLNSFYLLMQYITLDNVMDLVGSDANNDEEAMSKMWADSMTACNCSTARITYDDFLMIMKGQTKENEDVAPSSVKAHEGVSQPNYDAPPLHVVPEELDNEVNHHLPVDAQGSKLPILSDGGTPTSFKAINSSLGPLMPLTPTAPYIDTPLSMDDDDDLPISPHADTYPMPDVVFTLAGGVLASELNNSNPELPKSILGLPRPPRVARQKSRSMDESEMKKRMILPTGFPTDARRAVNLPETDPERRDALLNGTNKCSALQTNRNLYRAHRHMRLAVMEASKRFEEQQVRHARDVLIAQEEEKRGGAGLIMRRVENKTITAEAVTSLLEQNHKEQQDLMEKASRLGGRGRLSRRKTISDIGGMLGSLSQDEMTNICMQATEANSAQMEPLRIPPVIETRPMGDSDADTNLRGATVPGEFRKVNDPFGAHGKYSVMVGDDVQ